MTGVQTRLMEQRDLDAILNIQAECYVEVEPESRSSIVSKLLLSPRTCWVALCSDQVIAYLICFPWEHKSIPPLNEELASVPKGIKTFYIHDLAVTPSERSSGVGFQLIKQALDCAKNMNFSQANLVAVQKSTPFWKKFGFVQSELASEEANIQLKTYGESSIYMEANLATGV